MTELLDSQNAVVVLALLQNLGIGEQLHAEGAGGSRSEVNVLGVQVLSDVLSLQRSIVVGAVQEAHPTSGELFDLTAVNSGDVVLVLVLLHVPAVPVLVLDQLVVGTGLELDQLVGAPGSGGFQRGVVVRGPQGSAVSGSDLAGLVQILLDQGQAGEVVGSPNRQAAVFLQEGVSLVQAKNNSVLLGDGVDTDIFPSDVTVLVLNIDSGVIASAGLQVSAIVGVQESTGSGIGTVSVVVNGLVGDGDILRTLVAVSIGVALGAPHVPDVDVQSLASINSFLDGGVTQSTQGLIGAFLVLEEVDLGVLDHQGVVVGVSAEVHEGGIQQFLHGVLEVFSGDSSAIVPLQVVTQGDLPCVAAFGLLLVGVAPLGVNRRGDVLQLGSSGVVGGVGTGNDAGLVDGSVCIELLVFFELVVILEERGANVAHDLGVVVVRIGELVPVAGHGLSSGVILSLLEGNLFDRLLSTTNEHGCDQHQAQNHRENGLQVFAHDVFLHIMIFSYFSKLFLQFLMSELALSCKIAT